MTQRDFGAEWSLLLSSGRIGPVGDIVPAGSKPAVTEAERAAATNRLHDLVADGLPLEHFATALDQILAAQDHDQLAVALEGLPPLVSFTPEFRRSLRLVEANAGTGVLTLGLAGN